MIVSRYEPDPIGIYDFLLPEAKISFSDYLFEIISTSSGVPASSTIHFETSGTSTVTNYSTTNNSFSISDVINSSTPS